MDNIQLASDDDDFTENESDKDKIKRNQSDKCVKLLTLHASKVYSPWYKISIILEFVLCNWCLIFIKTKQKSFIISFFIF